MKSYWKNLSITTYGLWKLRPISKMQINTWLLVENKRNNVVDDGDKDFNEEYIRHKYQPFIIDIPSRRLNSIVRVMNPSIKKTDYNNKKNTTI